jgi:large-conductance mechanosensitive channel
MFFSIVIWLVIIASLIYLLVRKIIKEENEDYENRDN